MMKHLFFAIVFLLVTSCVVNNPYAPPPGYARDDLYCWHKGQDGVWHVQGLSRECPDNTPMIDLDIVGR